MVEPAVLSPLYPLAEALERLLPALRAASAGGRLRLSGLRGAARAFLLARGLVRAPRPTLCLLPSAEAAEAFADDLRLFLGGEGSRGQRVHLYPAWDVPAFEGLSPSNETLAAQVEGLYYLLATATPVLVTSIEALAQCVFPQEELIAATFRLKSGQELHISHLLHQLYLRSTRRCSHSCDQR